MPSTFSLTEALLLAGAAVLVTMIVHGWWTARKADPRRPNFLGHGRQEPSLGSREKKAETPSTMDSVLDVLSAGDTAFAAQARADTLPMVAQKPRPQRRISRPQIIAQIEFHFDAMRIHMFFDHTATLSPTQNIQEPSEYIFKI